MGPAIHQNSVWVLFYFSHLIYLLFVFTSVLYTLPNLTNFTGTNHSHSPSTFNSVHGVDLLKFLVTPVILVLCVHASWTGPTLTAWFGHILFSQFQFKIVYVLTTFFLTYLAAFSISTHYSSTNTYDYVATLFSFFVWLCLIFFSNNLFTFIFFLEVLSALVMLLLVTSTFSSQYFYNNLSYSNHSYFQTSTPTALLQTLLFFFWVALISSLTLFVFLLLFYIRFLTFDWNIADSVFLFIIETGNLKALFSASFAWLLALVCVFMKCGIAPLYFWKPSFFKGMSLNSLFFYVYIYYFSIFMYFIYVLFFYLNELFLLNVYLVVAILLCATVSISSILLESYYVKAFLALSSILNSVLIFFALCSFQTTDLLFTL